MSTFEANNYGMFNVPPRSVGVTYVTDDIVELPATLAKDDLAKVLILPAGCVPVDIFTASDELDSNASDTLTMSVGIMNDDEDELTTAGTMISGAVADTAPTVTRGSGAGLLAIAPDEENDRVIGIEITAAAATAVAGSVRVVMTYRASNLGV